MKNKDALEACNYVFRLINIRLRSEKEIRDKLKLRGFSQEIIEKSIGYFKDLKLIDDREFALHWINSRVAKPLGFKVIEKELKNKGIEDDVIKNLINAKKKIINEDTIIKELMEKRINKLLKKREPADKIKNKLYSYLIRRGFSNNCIIDAINELVSEKQINEY